MKTRNYLLLVVVAIVATLNFSLSMNGRKLLSDLGLLTVEAMANAEYNPSAPLEKRYVKFSCGVETPVIVGHQPDGTPIVQTIVEEGEFGKCERGMGSCTPYECTRLLAY